MGKLGPLDFVPKRPPYHTLKRPQRGRGSGWGCGMLVSVTTVSWRREICKWRLNLSDLSPILAPVLGFSTTLVHWLHFRQAGS